LFLLDKPEVTTEAESLASRVNDTRIPVIFNGAAGSVAHDDCAPLVEALRAAGVDAYRVPVTRGADLKRVAADIARQQPAAVVAGGGDGTISAVASALVGTDVALGVLPLGTLNHFAKDAGIPLDPAEAARTIASGNIQRVDIGEVNGRAFLNNSSLGLYPHIVRQREEQQRRLGRGKWTAFAWATWVTLRHKPFLNVRLSMDEEERRCTASFVFVGNNEYLMEGFNIGMRERLDGGRLSLYLTRRRSHWGLVMLGLRALVGRLHQAEDFEATTAQSIAIETRRRHVHVALDGEVMVMETPLNYRIRPRALRVLVPAVGAEQP
jgi:diacylglycerol kinase family enzyme